MTGRLVFLYNRADKSEVSMVFGLACNDEELTSLKPWLDSPEVRHDRAATLSGDGELGTEIRKAIANADAVLFFVGSDGPGPYQKSTESGFVQETLAARAESDRPLRFLPVMLPDGEFEYFPDWMRRRLIVNADRSARTPPELWAEIRQRLLAAPSGADAGEPAGPALRRGTAAMAARALAKELRRVHRASLTIFIGPYSFAPVDDLIGPAALTETLLGKLGLSAKLLGPIMPWPSEAAQWVSVARKPNVVTDVFTSALGRAGLKPPALANSIGHLAKKWLRFAGEREEASTDWNGLLLLTTRVDLALESALSKFAGIEFTRILPTLNTDVEDQPIRDWERRQMVQQWRADPDWNPVPRPGTWSPPTLDLATAEANRLAEFSLDKAKRVILVKLCGSLDVPPSLILTAFDFFQKTADLQRLPGVIGTVIKTAPQLLLGRGFASPLAQLVRAFVLGRRQGNQSRIWVMPKASDDPDPDRLCQLELELLATKRDANLFKQAIQVNELHRGSQHQFVRLLGDAI